MRYLFEELLVFLCAFEFLVARSKECLRTCYVSGKPLVREWADECVVVILVLPGSDGKLLEKLGGQATPMKKRAFDDTKGFPGEDTWPTNFTTIILQ